MPKLYLHIPPIPYYLPRFVIRIGLRILLRYRIKKYGFTFRRIKLTGGKYTIVDPEDYDKLSCYNWQYLESRSTFYAVRMLLENGKVKIIRMHREIMQAPKGRVVDHHDHDGLNNRKSNLTIATAAENRRHCRKIKAGTSKYKGVCRHKGNNKWHARISVNGQSIHLGYFDSEIEAAKAYDKAAKELHGEFAVLNFNKELKS